MRDDAAGGQKERDNEELKL